jgi:hypothetical protein
MKWLLRFSIGKIQKKFENNNQSFLKGAQVCCKKLLAQMVTFTLHSLSLCFVQPFMIMGGDGETINLINEYKIW